MRPFEKRVLSTLRERALLPRSGTILLAVSGGADSLAMLHALAALLRRRRGLKLYVGHLNHGIRGAEAAADARFVRRECRRLGVPCAVGAVDVPALARQGGVGTEEAGRMARYDFLARLARRVGAEVIATAHHADDQAETVLMRVRRGAGPRGLAGIPYERELPPARPGHRALRLIRPLLDASRDEIDDYLKALGLTPRLDATNASTRYLRNRVRLRVLPALARRRPGIRAELLRIASAARSLRAVAERLRARAAAGLTRLDAGCLIIDAAAARHLPPELVLDAVDAALRNAALLPRMLTRRDFDALLRLLRAGRAASLSGGLVARRAGDEVAVLPADRAVIAERRLPVSRSLRAAGRRSSPAAPSADTRRPAPPVVTATLLAGSMELLARRLPDGSVEFLDYDRVRLPLTLRPARPGDRMRPLGMKGRRKISDILTDLKVPAWRKRPAMVVTSRNQPIWLVGRRISDDVKLTPATRRVLRLALHSG
jgi:tRNA(Ile)-lysidine synthase